MPNFQKPTFASNLFVCPHCDGYTQQTWYAIHRDNVNFIPREDSTFVKLLPYQHPHFQPQYSGVSQYADQSIYISQCTHCHKIIIWYNFNIIYPLAGTAASPNNYMPNEVKALYNEAASVCTISPRSAAALLRLALQILLKELGGDGKNINDDIAKLTKDGVLKDEIKTACDILRVIGNNAVHPGQIDIEDNTEITNSLFELLNLIVSETLERKAKIDSLYSLLPKGAKEAIEKRDLK